MKALAKFGKPSEFGTYHFIDVPEPTCGDDDVIIEIKAAAICGADMKHFMLIMDLKSSALSAATNSLVRLSKSARM